MEDAHDIVAALVDGERVDADDLQRALGDVDARDYLIDLLALREVVAGRPVVLNTASGQGRRSSTAWWLVAAAALCISTLTGFVAGQRQTQRAVSAPTHTSAAPGNAQRDSMPTGLPKPTSVIRLQSGVDWNERPGGS
jgi:hypothetical protein